MRQTRTLLILDLFRQPNSFLASEAAHLARRLEADGAQVEVVSAVLDDAASREKLASTIRGMRPVMAIMLRAWDARLIDLVRGAMPSSTPLARFARRGVESALDARFDRVIDDPEALVAWARGEPVEGGARFVPSSARALRQRPAELASSPPRQVVGGAAVLTRPTISGPAGGCPYLADVRKNSIFEPLELNPDAIQTHGCSFCLDNFGSYVAYPPRQVLDSWLAQLRAVREVAPMVREVLLTDERPHAQLPAFFEALVSEPSLHAVELLIKSRVDWLIEGEQDLADAAEQALRTGSVVHPYLVGFENFDAWHLKLFNKGYDAEQNARAIELLRRLKARYPDSFEYRRHRAHGIVLFTPWTEPEALLENARWMRKVGFAELRSAALETRLRLYPRLPLYAKAQADGLLAESFGHQREDRASEQGYDASTPWRFADSRTAAIESACRDLRHLGLDDADLLELCAEFVLRWPSLAQRPGAASWPILQALRAWGRPPSSLLATLGPRLAGWDPELETIGEGVRRCALKEDVPREHGARLVDAYGAMGLCAGVVSAHRLQAETGDHSSGDQRVKVAVARTREDLEALVSVQRELEETGGFAALAQAGRLLGYPPCCVRALSTRERPGDNLANERAPFRRAPEAPLAPELNRLGWASVVRHHLCSPDCAASLEQAQAVLVGLEGLDAAGAHALRERLARPLLSLDYLRRAELDGHWVGESFHVDAFEWLEPDAERAVPGHRIRELRLDPGGVVFELDDGAPRRLEACAPLLVEPGRALTVQARAALTEEPGGSLRQGRRIGAFELTRLRTTGDERELRLQRDAERVELRIRPHDPARPQTIRRGRWALDIRDPLDLSEDAKRAITWVLRSLPR